jgi:hypothetical protein
MYRHPSDPMSCWLHYMRVFALQTPSGLPVKITVGVSGYEGERIARLWQQEPTDVVDAYGRPCKQVQTEDKLIAIEWLTPDKVEPGGAMTWGMMPPQLPKR